jgi:hypothetical protein
MSKKIKVNPELIDMDACLVVAEEFGKCIELVS